MVSKRKGFLGNLYWEGKFGVEKDARIAQQWLEKAAKKGDITAAQFLGRIYYNGDGVEKNPEKAFKWYEKAARLGDPQSEYIVAMMCLKGEGTKENPEEAVSWLKLAAGQDHVGAMALLSICYSSGLGIKADAEIGRVWKERALKLQKEQEEKAATGNNPPSGEVTPGSGGMPKQGEL